MIRRLLTYHLFLLILCAASSQALHAQLISPGKLSTSHSFLEGISHCTSCHELRNPEIINEKCTSCHTPIQASIDQLSGVHGQPEVIRESCASCHKEHFGAQFDVLHFDSTDFDHSITGFDLDNAHAELECQSCHGESSFLVDSLVLAYRAEYELIGASSTFLGMDAECAGCHITDNIHGDQFLGESCSTCHTTKEFEGAESFNHNNAAFQLTGAHIDVECKDCHDDLPFEDSLITKYVDIDFESCENCHEDVHEGKLTTLTEPPNTCETCHTTNDWHEFTEEFPESTFDHSETGFLLVGAHNTIECESCHSPRNDELIVTAWQSGSEKNTYPSPISESCADCHVDYHEGVFVHTDKDSDCQNCHTETAWYPSTFGLDAHNTKSQFSLIGAHITTPCFSCHQPELADFSITKATEKPKFRFEDVSCNSCHDKDNPHGDLSTLWEGSSSDDCEACHNENSWNADIEFDHEGITGYALTGAHQLASCESCHFENSVTDRLSDVKSFSLISDECASCHKTDSPHQGQFQNSVIGPSCDGCHTTEAFTLADFDHSRTSYPLDGAHENVACVDCHTTEASADNSIFTRFFPVSSECSSCHGNN